MLYESEGGNLAKPSITRTTHTLPFNKLSPLDFERLCLWLVRREGYVRTEHLGDAGSEQGRDITAWRDGKLWAFQCKRVQTFGPSDALKEVDKILALPDDQRPVGLVFLVTCKVSDNTRQQARERCDGEMECQFWVGTEFDEKVKRHPDIVQEFFQVAEPNFLQRLFSPGERRAQRNRQTMLKLVKDFWIKGVLEKSLHNEVLIELGLEERPDAVEHPWDTVLQTERESRTLPPDTKIIEVFDEMGGSLLILGGPGSGKTTMLLELARDTIAHAEEDPTQSIPAVFNLSSWVEKRQPIADWLVEELNTKYSIPQKVACSWVENDELLLLLDGLDEVASERREDCIKAINDFRLKHLVSMVVCSRVRDYELLANRLRLQGAVLLQPLTSQQIENYLDRVEMMTICKTWQSDAALREMIQSPLMLSILALACQGVSVKELQLLGSVGTRRRHILKAYVQQVFERRRIGQNHSPDQVLKWLSWLACRMSEHSQTIFLVERMQPSWLSTPVQRRLFALGVMLATGVPVGLLIGWGGGLPIRLAAVPAVRQTFGVALTLAVGLTVCLAVRRTFSLTSSVFVGSAFGLTFGAAFAMQFTAYTGLMVGGIIGLAAGTSFGLVGRWLRSKMSASWDTIEVVEALSWSWKRAVLGLVIGLIAGFAFGFTTGQAILRTIALDFGFAFGLAAGLVAAILSGLSGGKVEIRTRPNQGTWQSTRNAVRVGIAIALAVGLPIGWVTGSAWGGGIFLTQALTVGMTIGLAIGLAFGMAVGLFFGGLTLIQHLTLRLILSCASYLPWNLVPFLDYAAERILLRKVGGGYIFIHRLLQEYFASLYEGEEAIA